MRLAGGGWGRAIVPRARRTGAHEAVELRDGDKARYGGKGVLRRGRERQQRDRRGGRGLRRARPARPRPAADRPRRDAEQGPPRRQCAARRLAGHRPCRGRVARAQPLYRYLGGDAAARPAGAAGEHPQRRQARGGLDRLPGVHDRALGAADLRRGAALGGRDVPRAGRAPRTSAASPPRSATRAATRRACETNEAAIGLVLEAIQRAGYRPGEQIAIALDPAATEVYSEGRYVLTREQRTF